MPRRVTGDDASLAPTLPYLGARMVSVLPNYSVGLGPAIKPGRFTAPRPATGGSSVAPIEAGVALIP
jgi:hypothetical protein